MQLISANLGAGVGGEGGVGVRGEGGVGEQGGGEKKEGDWGDW